uniref:CHAT domain-containing protein n=1 Tax=Candidatus Kentrum sp. FW TaxID=2126338 RepID=A0A450TYI1_9GAMM|nr:MAG: CHAT domain-containing protein [Candidatus Kentron sp. FW]
MTPWPLDDELAGEFMADFYGNWFGDGASTSLANLTPAQAPHKTRLAWITSKDEARRDPRHWVPYMLPGSCFGYHEYHDLANRARVLNDKIDETLYSARLR